MIQGEGGVEVSAPAHPGFVCVFGDAGAKRGISGGFAEWL